MPNLTALAEAELVGRLVLSAALAGILGWERQVGQQPAGLRTHMLVSIGATAYTLAGTIGVAGLGTVQDPGRVAAQIVTGIGFIGAGTIWRSSGNDRIIRGLTTAASIWVAASIGMLCGYGLYILATGCALVGFAVLRLIKGLEHLPGVAWSRLSHRLARSPRQAIEPQPQPEPEPAAPISVSGETEGTTAVRDGVGIHDSGSTNSFVTGDGLAHEAVGSGVVDPGRPRKKGHGKKGGKRRRQVHPVEQFDHISDS